MIDPIGQEPYLPPPDLPGLWSLYEMLRFRAMSFTAAISNLETVAGTLGAVALVPDKDQGRFIEMMDLPKKTIEALTGIVETLREVPVAKAIRDQAKRALDRSSNLDLEERHNRTVVITLVQELMQNVVTDLTEHLYVLVPSGDRSLVQQIDPPFGNEVALRFGVANGDIAAAAQCLAFEQHTACVFHLMRALEHGLRDLSARVGSTFAAGIELENWKNIIDVIVADIKKLEQLPKSATKSADLEYYSKAAQQFWHFKEAWRNHVSHAKTSYSKPQAREVYDSVRLFMQNLAARP